MRGFKVWVEGVVSGWGFIAVPGDKALVALLEKGGTINDLDRELLGRLLREHGDHPDLLRLSAAAAVETGDEREAWEALRRYGRARPVDPWADRELVKLAQTQGRLADVVDSLERLDVAEQETGRWAVALTGVHRRAGRLPEAAAAIRRALEREPFDAGYRELAAAVALQVGDLDGAVSHIQALTVLESDRVQHWVRLAAVLHMKGEREGAHEAGERALKMDPNAAVSRFMDPATAKTGER